MTGISGISGHFNILNGAVEAGQVDFDNLYKIQSYDLQICYCNYIPILK